MLFILCLGYQYRFSYPGHVGLQVLERGKNNPKLAISVSSIYLCVFLHNKFCKFSGYGKSVYSNLAFKFKLKADKSL